MAILKVARVGHPVLRTAAQPIDPDSARSPDIQRFVDDMIDTMRDYDGVGLAAPQVHVGRRVIVFEVESNPRYPQAPPVPLTVLLNPSYSVLDEELVEDWEGCLSLPDLRGRVPRFRRVRVRGWDRAGRPVELDAEGFHARVVQHECDHIEGRIFLDRMRSLESLTHLTELQRYWTAPPKQR